jgi:hypothetical protein
VPTLWQLLSAPNSNRHIQADFKRQFERHLFIFSYGYLGWPAHDNAWLYPEIHAWDDYKTPSHISFLTNFAEHVDDKTLTQFRLHLGNIIPGPWEFELHLDESWIMAIRKPYAMIEEVNDRDSQITYLSTLEYERILHVRSAAARNGRKRGEIGKTVRFMRRDI